MQKLNIGLTKLKQAANRISLDGAVVHPVVRGEDGEYLTNPKGMDPFCRCVSRQMRPVAAG